MRDEQQRWIARQRAARPIHRRLARAGGLGRSLGVIGGTMGKTINLVGDRQCIDIRNWHRKGLAEPGKSLIREGKDNDLPVISMNVEVEPDMVVLRYQARPPNDQSGQRNDTQERVCLTYTTCNYGGRRPWFICPMPECNRRVAVLYLHGMHFF